MLFPDADDPFGALRWALSELRRALGPACAISGDPVRLVLPPEVNIDVRVVTGGTCREAVEVAGLDRPLLEGVEPTASAAFELWLVGERRRFQGLAASVLHEAAHSSLAHGEPEAAVGFASRLMRLDPLDENHHVLMVRCLCRAGRRAEAESQAQRSTLMLQRELATPPSPALRQALSAEQDGPAASPALIVAKLRKGQAAVAAGALDEGLWTLRTAVSAARRAEEHELLAGALVAVGEALVQAARGGDEEGAAALHEAGVLAMKVGNAPLATTARRELAWVEYYRGRYDRLLPLLDEATHLAGDDDIGLAWLELIRGAALSDMGRYAASEAVLGSALARADRSGVVQVSAFAQALLGRILLLRRQLTDARTALEQSLDLSDHAGWVAFVPLPEVLLGELELLEGAIETAASRFDRARELACEVADPCWESLATRGLGLVAAARGHGDDALRLLIQASMVCRRVPDASRWVEAYALDALCTVALDGHDPRAAGWVAELESRAAQTGMREFVARAALHRARLGEAGALEAARLLAGRVDNPALHESLRTLERSHGLSHAQG